MIPDDVRDKQPILLGREQKMSPELLDDLQLGGHLRRLFSNGHSALRFLRGGNRAEAIVLGIIGIA
jgi:hypothetical protein